MIDYTISLGQIVQAASFLVGGIALVAIYGYRVKLLEEWVKEHRACSINQLKITTEMLQSLAYIKGALGIKENQ